MIIKIQIEKKIIWDHHFFLLFIFWGSNIWAIKPKDEKDGVGRFVGTMVDDLERLGFEDALMGMEKDEEKTISIPVEEAYGEARPEMIQKVPRDKFPTDQEPKVDMMLMLQSPTGHQMPAKITELTETEITLDMNHPLAGKVLNFKLKIVEIN